MNGFLMVSLLRKDKGMADANNYGWPPSLALKHQKLKSLRRGERRLHVTLVDVDAWPKGRGEARVRPSVMTVAQTRSRAAVASGVRRRSDVSHAWWPSVVRHRPAGRRSAPEARRGARQGGEVQDRRNVEGDDGSTKNSEHTLKRPKSSTESDQRLQGWIRIRRKTPRKTRANDTAPPTTPTTTTRRFPACRRPPTHQPRQRPPPPPTHARPMPAPRARPARRTTTQPARPRHAERTEPQRPPASRHHTGPALRQPQHRRPPRRRGRRATGFSRRSASSFWSARDRTRRDAWR